MSEASHSSRVFVCVSPLSLGFPKRSSLGQICTLQLLQLYYTSVGQRVGEDKYSLNVIFLGCGLSNCLSCIPAVVDVGRLEKVRVGEIPFPKVG